MHENHHEMEDVMNISEILYTAERLKEYHDAFKSLSIQKSGYQRMRFETLKDEGFTSRQAIEIIKNERTPYDI